MPFEIIQIGALKLNENLETISTFDSLIKPTIYKYIHPFVANLTKITMIFHFLKILFMFMQFSTIRWK